MELKKIKMALVISADMRLGHQRATFSLKDIAEKEIITAGDANIISKKEYKFWKKGRRTYEFLSRSRQVPIVGKYLFNILDYFQNIKPIYQRRNLSRPTIQTYYLSKLVKKSPGLEIIRYYDTAIHFFYSILRRRQEKRKEFKILGNECERKCRFYKGKN